jgi:membrane peptidoglycan carboxypeptidase
MKKPLKISIFIIALFLGIYYLLPFALPLKIPPTPTSLLVYDSHQTHLGEIVNQFTYRHQFLPLSETPNFITESIVVLEDNSFRTNDGISRKGLLRALQKNLKS